MTILIPACKLTMDGTIVDRQGLGDVYSNRAKNCASGTPPWVSDRTLKGPIAIVGYGPSLHQTWERLRQFDTIITVSRAHDYLLERGITPTYHLDLDSRMHKVEFMKAPQKDIQYILSTHIHPAYVEKVTAAGASVRLFHVGIEKHMKLDPRYPVFKPRFDAGVQAAELMFQHGHREQHWFGIEYGCSEGNTHAGMHWGVKHPPESRCIVECDGRKFESTKLFFHGLLLAEDFLCKRALVRCTIHGDGLLGWFLKDRNRVRPTLEV